jgi:hypothetical protein
LGDSEIAMAAFAANLTMKTVLAGLARLAI